MTPITSLKIGKNTFSIGTIGDTKQTSAPILDLNYHLANGDYIQKNQGKIYDYILKLEEQYPSKFTCTETEYQDSLSTYQQYGKNVLDPENQRVRLSTLSGFISLAQSKTLGFSYKVDHIKIN